MKKEDKNLNNTESNRELSTEFVEKNNNTLVVVIITVLVIAVLALGGYIAYDKIILSKDVEKNENVDNTNSNNDKVKDETTKISFNVTDEDILTKVKEYNSGFYEYYLTGEKSEITDRERLTFAYFKILNRSLELTSSNLEEILVEYFGKNHGVTIGDIYCDVDNTVWYKYDAENDIYVRSGTHGHGGGQNLVSYTRLDSTEVMGDKLVVKARVAFAKMCSDTCGPASYLYASYNDMKNNTNPVYGDNEKEIMEYTDDIHNSIKNKLLVRTYTFNIEKDGNYYLESVSVEK